MHPNRSIMLSNQETPDAGPSSGKKTPEREGGEKKLEKKCTEQDQEAGAILHNLEHGGELGGIVHNFSGKGKVCPLRGREKKNP